MQELRHLRKGLSAVRAHKSREGHCARYELNPNETEANIPRGSGRTCTKLVDALQKCEKKIILVCLTKEDGETVQTRRCEKEESCVRQQVIEIVNVITARQYKMSCQKIADMLLKH